MHDKGLITASFAIAITAMMLFVAVPTNAKTVSISQVNEMSIWEAYAKGYVTIDSVNDSYGSPVGIKITNSREVKVSIDDYVMLMNPHPLDVPPFGTTTQDGVLEPGITIMPGEAVTFYYGSYTVDNGIYFPHLGEPAWWCTELGQVTTSGATISLGGEILPYSVVDIVENQSSEMDLWVFAETYGIDPGYGVLRNYEIWHHFNTHPSLVVGKTPLWAQILPQKQSNITISLAVTNLGYMACDGAKVMDVVPAGYSYSAANPLPTEITNPDGSITLVWEMDIEGAVQTIDQSLPNYYPTEWVTYTLTTPALDSGARIFLLSATIDFEGDENEDAHSAQPLIEVQYMVDEGDTVQFDWSGEDSSSVSFAWDLDDNGLFDDAYGPNAQHTWPDDSLNMVSLEALNNNFGITDEDSMSILVMNVPPEVQISSEPQFVEVSLRVAGSKWSNVGVTLYEDDNPIGYIEVERWPGSPDDNPYYGSPTLPILFDRTKSYKAIVTYDPYPDNGDEIKGDQPNNGKDKFDNAGNPVWIILTSEDGNSTMIHHTFNTQQSKIRKSGHWNHVEPWEVELNGYLAGLSITLEGMAYDPGADGLSFIWEFNDGTVITHDYPNVSGVNPVTVFDTVDYSGTASEVMLTVIDDDGGVGVETIAL